MKATSRALLFFVFLTGLSCKTMEPDICIDPDKIKLDGVCTMQYDPVCGCDGKTYGNACQANNAGVRSYSKGACSE